MAQEKIKFYFTFFFAINIDGKTPNREHIIQNFQDIDYSILCSARVLQEGVDIPKCDGVIFIDIKLLLLIQFNHCLDV